MALSPNYNWSEPDNSSLVKNGAADIRTLGDAIDTSLWNVGFGQAGKNKIINGDFGIWQRGTSFSITADTYTADRWVSQVNGNGTRTVSQQAFTAGTAPVAGYEGQFFLRMACTASGTATYFNIKQKIEDVRTFAGNTVTVSFWAKASASLTTSFFGITQDFGSGGSGAVDTAGSNLTFTTSWVRYTQTFTIPSIAGKTIGTGSNLALAVSFGSSTFTSFDIWGVQLEYGSKATPFETASGTIAGELALCQYYFEVLGSLYGYAFSSSQIQGLISHTPKRVTPSIGLTTTTPYAESPINVTARTGSGSTPTGSPDPNRYSSSLIRIDGFSGMVATTNAYINSGQITMSAEL